MKSQMGIASIESMEQEEEEEDGTMNEFLSRFVFKMRGNLVVAYPNCDKQTIDGMLLVIVDKVVEVMEKEGGLEGMLSENNGVSMTTTSDFSEDLWRIVWEVSSNVLEDMEKERKKEKMKGFLQCDEVKEMCRFAGEVGVRGDMLKEFRFKWAKEKMEESEFFEELERLREESKLEEEADGDGLSEENVKHKKVVTLPKRHGKIKYKIYGLDLSGSKWREVADKIHKAEEIIWPHDPKPVTGKCKLVMEKILSLNESDDPSPLLAEWKELLEPIRVDWVNLLNQVKERNSELHLKVSELLLDEKSFQTEVSDFSQLIDAHAKNNRLADVERILNKMTGNGISPNVMTATALVLIYCKAGNFERAKEAFDSLRNAGFQPDVKVYNSMILAFISAGQPSMAEALLKEMDTREIKPSADIYMALLRSFADCRDIKGVQRISTVMQFLGYQQSREYCTVLVETYSKVGDADQAKSNFDYMIKLGFKPDDRCTASMIEVYQKSNLLDKAFYLLSQLKKDGFEPGLAVYSVMVDWLAELQLIYEAECLLGKIAELGEAPGLKLQVSLCVMYSKAKNEKKTLQALGVLEAKVDQFSQRDFERIIDGLVCGGFTNDAKKMQGLMEGQGFTLSEHFQVAIAASHSFRGSRR
ncbi:hypothetical protein ACFE04_003227 [Oxalis oulophora]